MYVYNHKLKYVEFEVVPESSNEEIFFFGLFWMDISRNKYLAKLSIHATYFPLAGLKITIHSYIVLTCMNIMGA